MAGAGVVHQRGARRDRRQVAQGSALPPAASGDWLVRLGDGTEESHAPQAATHALRQVHHARPSGSPTTTSTATRPAGPGPAWDASVKRLDGRWPVPRPLRSQPDWPDTRLPHHRQAWASHSEHLGYLLAEMQTLPRASPERHLVVVNKAQVLGHAVEVPGPRGAGARWSIWASRGRGPATTCVAVTPRPRPPPSATEVIQQATTVTCLKGARRGARVTQLARPGPPTGSRRGGREAARLRHRAAAPGTARMAQTPAASTRRTSPCPRCGSPNTAAPSAFGATPARRCTAARLPEPLEHFKPI